MKKQLIALGLVSAAILIAVLMNLFRSAPEKLTTPEAAIAVKTEILQKADVTLTVESQGTVRPRTRTVLTSEVSATLLELSDRFVVGAHFNKGDILMRLDPRDYEVALQRAEAKLSSRKALLEFEKARAFQARKEWAMTDRPESEAPALALRKPYLAEAEANLLQALAEVKQAEVKLGRTSIRAPYAGMVTKKNIDIGQYVTLGSRLGEIFATDFVEIRLPLTDQDLAMMKTPLPGRVGIESVELEGSNKGYEVKWRAIFERFEGVVNEVNRSQYAVVSVADPYRLKSTTTTLSAPLLVGTFVRARLSGKTLKNVFKVPRGALLQGSKIAVVDLQSSLRTRSVEIMYADDEFYYIDEGLDESLEVVVSAIGTPIEGLKLRVKNIAEKDRVN